MDFRHQKTETVEVVWEGDSLDVLRRFPGPVKQDLGAELRRLQECDRPLHSRPMPSIGNRVYELKEQDERAWYRVIYLAKIRNRIYILHYFEKKSAKTGKSDLATAKARLRQVLARLAEER